MSVHSFARTGTGAWPTPPPSLLVVDDEQPVLALIERVAHNAGYDVMTCSNGSDALRLLARKPADLAMVDLRMPDVSGLDLLRDIRRAVPGCEVILMTGHAGVDSAIEAIRRGAREYLTKPFDFERLGRALDDVRKELAQRAQAVAAEGTVTHELEFCGMLGASPAMQEVFGLIQRLAPHAKTVLVNGETGTGKELTARAFHQTGPRRARPFLTVNCSAVVGELFESELFGHVRGAFSGAFDAQAGLFEAAQGGTVFLDEIGELPLPLQAKLLRALEFGEVQRVGSMETTRVDVAVIAATNRDLRADVAAGRFRSDLFYRLNVVEVTLPPLRERREDIPHLTAAFMRDSARRMRKPLTGITPGAERLLLEAPWAGNVRELRNVVERACMFTDAAVLAEADIEGSLEPPLSAGNCPIDLPAAEAVPQPPLLHEVERGHIVEVLRRVNGNRSAAAKLLGISRRALYRRLDRHHIGDPA